MPEQLKVSEIPGYLDQIQSGGGGSTPFTYIDYIEYKGKKYTENNTGVVYDIYTDSKIDIKLKIKDRGQFIITNPNVTIEPDDTWFKSGKEYSLNFSETHIDDFGFAIIVGENNDFDETFHSPDMFFFLDNNVDY